MCLCLGPLYAGKTLLLRSLCGEEIDQATSSVRTDGLNLYDVRTTDKKFVLTIKELGGSMAPIWTDYLDKVYKLIFVIDASNLCQISADGVLLYTLLADPRLQNTKFALVLSKMDLSYRQMRNEALLMLHIHRLRKEIRQNITIIEASALTGVGVEELRNWIFDPGLLANAARRAKLG